MRTQKGFVECAVGIVVIMLSVVFMKSVAARGEKKTVWEGVYTSGQADRGQDIYDKRCTECHQDDLSGNADEGAPVLRGADFLARWNGKTVGDLFRRIEESMPKNAPGSLSETATAEVIAFLLKKNQIPASDGEMPADAAKLDEIEVTNKPR